MVWWMVVATVEAWTFAHIVVCTVVADIPELAWL